MKEEDKLMKMSKNFIKYKIQEKVIHKDLTKKQLISIIEFIDKI